MNNASIARLRRDYAGQHLTDQAAPSDPLRLFHHWFRQALKVRSLDANAMTLATVGPGGQPDARVVLLKGLDAQGFVFFTNYQSRKGRELKRQPKACLLFFWPDLHRQVRVEGKVQKLTARESDLYFKTRPRGSQVSAWASPQSEVIEAREILDRRMAEVEAQFQGRKVPRPPHWGGYRLVPQALEFWSGRHNRLHDRLAYKRKGAQGWRRERLAP